MSLFWVISGFLPAYYYTLDVIAVIDTSEILDTTLAGPTTRSHDVTVTVTYRCSFYFDLDYVHLYIESN